MHQPPSTNMGARPRTRAWFGSALLVLGLWRCSVPASGDLVGKKCSPAFDTNYYAALSAKLHDAFMRSDTAFGDSMMYALDDTALARSHPDRVRDGFVSIVIAHNNYPAKVMDAFGRLGAYAHTDSLLAWYDFLTARWRMMRGDQRGAIELYTALLPRFERIGDTNGIAATNRRIGQIYRALGEFDIAKPYLVRALPLEKMAEFRCNILYALAQCYAQEDNIDSLRWCERAVMNEARDPVLLRRADDRAALYAGLLHFNADALEARDKRTGDALQLRRSFTSAFDSIRARPDSLGFMEGRDAGTRVAATALLAQALAAVGDAPGALAVVAAGEGTLAECEDCALQGIALYSAAAETAKQQGDLPLALRYQELRGQLFARNESGKARLAIEHARAKAELDRQEADAHRSLERERITARERDIEQRMQRILLIVLIAFIILFAGLLFVRTRIDRRIQLEQLRTRLSRDLHDDIGSTLSSINILSTVARHKAEAGDDAGAAASLSGISERTQRLMRNMSDIVWSVDPDRDTLEELLVRMREFGAAVLEPKGIAYRFDVSGELSAAIPPLVKSNLYLIFKEALNNAAKHAQATEVTVSFIHGNNKLHMTIADNGEGLVESDPAESTMGGNGLRNMRARAAEMKAELRIRSTPPAGTTIDLEVPW